MKKVTLLFFLKSLILISPVMAQSNFKLFAESGYAIDISDEGYSGFSVHLIPGMTWGNSGFFSGIGSGFDLHSEEQGFSNSIGSFSSIPVYVDLRFAFVENSFGPDYAGFYYYLDGGYTFPFSTLATNQSIQVSPGLYIMSGLGGVITIGAKDVSLNVNIGYRYEEFEVIDTGQSEAYILDLKNLCIKLGAIYKPNSSNY